jgi:hypothetical protein
MWPIQRGLATAPVFVVGDVHGHPEILLDLLGQAGLVGRDGQWSGADARVWLVGDLTDRGPDGIAAIDLVRRLERESEGALRCLLGNHEVLLLAAHRFPNEETSLAGRSFHELWKLNGGVDADLRGLSADQVGWIEQRPPLALDGDWLLLHADTPEYLELGDSVASVAERAATLLRHGTADDLDLLWMLTTDRMRLADPAAVDALLDAYGGTRIVHGHTPIASIRGIDPADVTEPLVYGDGRVMNVDHCLFAGGRGFVTRLEGGSGPKT